jgi:hypothetical protein
MVLSLKNRKLVTKKGRGDLVQTLLDRIKVCLMNGYTTSQLIRTTSYISKLPNFQFGYFKIQHKDKGLQGIRSLSISSQEPTRHENGNSFVTQQHILMIDTPFPLDPSFWKLYKQKYETKHHKNCFAQPTSALNFPFPLKLK